MARTDKSVHGVQAGIQARAMQKTVIKIKK